MKIALVQVGDRLSLEMDAVGFDAVWALVEQIYSDVQVAVAGSHDRVRFGGAVFLHENEWDQPCLLSQTPEGDALLKEVAGHFA